MAKNGRTAKQRAASRANLAKARKANQSQIAYQKANPGTPIVRMDSRPRYDKNGNLRQKGKVGSRLRKALKG